MAKIVLQNQASPITPDCGFTAMYVNCITGLPTFKRDDGTECSFMLACGGTTPWGDMCQCMYDPNCINADVFAMDNMSQGTCNKYVTGEQITCWDNKANSCDVYNKAEVDCKISQVAGITLCPVQELPETGELGVIYMVQKEGGCCDNSDEYVWRDDTCTFEFIGTTQVDMSDYAKCCDIPDTSDLAQCCDIPDISNLAQCCDIPTVPTDNCQLANGCGYTTCTGDMQKCMYDPDNKATNMYNMDNMDDGTCKVAMTTAERTKLTGISGCNTGDETTASIKCKLGISTLSGCNTGDETNSTIKCKLGAASCADGGYLKACDFASFTNKQNQLVSGENIITINGCTILRCGDICVENLGGDMKACVYDPYGCCTDMFNRANHYGCMSYACVAGLGSAATRDIGTNCGNVVVVQNDGKISSDVLPAQDVVDVCVFNDEASMLAWSTANRGDMAIRTDIARTYVMSGSCPSCIDSWTILPVPSSPVTSVNGCIGDVCLTTDNIDDSNSTKKYVSASEKACWCGKADPYVSGCTIKTINGCSVLGCGDICIPNTITCVNGKTGNVCLTADDISDTGTGHLFVSQTEKNTWNCKISCEDAIVDNCQLCNGCNYVNTNYLNCNYWCKYNWNVDAGDGFVFGTGNGCGLNPVSSGLTSAITLGGATFACVDMDNNSSNGTAYLFDSIQHIDIKNQCIVRYAFDKCATGIAQICDIPTNNNQLTNGCGYIKGINCSDVTTALGFTPYNATNPCGYTSCTGTLVPSDIACINGCCLTNGGSITIDGGNTKTFYLTGTTGATNIATAQAAVDWYLAGKNPILVYDKGNYILSYYSSTYAYFYLIGIGSNHCNSYTIIRTRYIKLTISNGTVTAITNSYDDGPRVLVTNCNYSTPYIPCYDGSPATKKYVDDNKGVAECCIATINGCCLTQGGDICIEGGGGDEGNIKTFCLSSSSDLTNAQAALDWFCAGKYFTIFYRNRTYLQTSNSSSFLTFCSLPAGYSDCNNCGYTINQSCYIYLYKCEDGCTAKCIVAGPASYGRYYLAANINYSTPYTPQYDGSPATKKYVDDNKGIQNYTTGTTSTVTKIRAGTEAEFALITPTSGVEYHVYPN